MDYSAINVLIVSSDPHSRRKYAEIFIDQNEAKFNAIEATSGDEARELCSSHPIDCMLLDSTIVKSAHSNFLTEFQTDRLKDNKIIPIILLADSSHQHLARNALENGVQDFLIKESTSTTGILYAVMRAVRTANEQKTVTSPNHGKNNFLFEHILDQIKESLFIFELQDGKMIEANHGASQTFNIKRDDLVNKNIYDIEAFRPGLEDWEKNIAIAKQSCKDVIFQTFYKNVDGKISPLKVNLNFVENNGVSYVIAMAYDMNTKQILDEKFQDLVFIDEDAKIYTEKYLNITLEKEFRRAMRMTYPLSIVIATINNTQNLHLINPTIKMPAIINIVAQCLSANLKRAGDFVAHYREQDFAILLPNTNTQQAQALCEIIIDDLTSKNTFFDPQNSTGKFLSLAMGIATEIPSISSTIENFMGQAIIANKNALNKEISTTVVINQIS